jgi:serine/threonine-protein kinase RsbW
LHDRGPCGPGGERFDVAIPSDVARIEGVVETVVAHCAARDYPRRACALNLPVALTEALANAIVNGNREDAGKRVQVRGCVDDRELVVEVHDEGPGFDLAGLTNRPGDAGFVEREDGRGLYLMQTLMDRVEQYAVPDRGNVVRLTLRRRT